MDDILVSEEEYLVPEERETLDTYGIHAAEWSKRHGAADHAHLDTEFNFLKKLLPKGRVLDVGAGDGFASEAFKVGGYRYIGVEPVETMRAIAKQLHPTADVREGDLYRLPQKRRSVDCVIAISVLVHAPKKRIRDALASIYGVLRPGGIALITLKEGEGEAMEPIPWDSSRRRLMVYWQMNEFLGELGWCGLKSVRSYRKLANGIWWLVIFAQKK